MACNNFPHLIWAIKRCICISSSLNFLTEIILRCSKFHPLVNLFNSRIRFNNYNNNSSSSSKFFSSSSNNSNNNSNK